MKDIHSKISIERLKQLAERRSVHIRAHNHWFQLNKTEFYKKFSTYKFDVEIIDPIVFIDEIYNS